MIMTFDTETADLSGNVYDFGCAIHNRKGEIVATYNALVRETFTDPDKMMGAFYARKLFTHYAPMLEAGEIKIVRWADIVERVRHLIDTYNVKTLAAYNLGFDMRVMRHTGSVLGSRLLHRSDFKLLDIWQFACEARLAKKTYKKIAREQGWVSKAGNLRTGAEYAYRFCSGDFGFIEDHTALSDALIEVEILANCFRQKGKVPYGVYNQSPWRLVNPDWRAAKAQPGRKIA